MKLWKTVFAACGIAAFMCGAADARPTVYPTGTTINNTEKAMQNVFVLAVFHSKVSILDRNGNEYHSWAVPTNYQNLRARLDKNGNLLLAGTEMDMTDRATLRGEKETPTFIAEYDWAGNKVWEHKVPHPYDWHNDVIKLKNGNILYTAYTVMPKEYQDKIRDVSLPWGNFKRHGVNMRGDVLREVEPKTGKLVWEWKTWEHLDLNKFSPVCPNSDWTHMNSMQELPENKWYDAGDKRFKPGNLLINPRNLDEFYVVDKATGKVVWTGNHSYLTGLAHCHEPNMIAKGLPGEGNIIFFDNGLNAKDRNRVGRTLLGELNPTTGELEWQYESKGYGNMHFFSATMGSESRLPNGNTFISEDNTGRLFEVTHDKKHPEGGEIVWEYVMPEYSQRSRVYMDDYCPQFKQIKRVTKPFDVVPPRNEDFHIAPTIKK